MTEMFGEAWPPMSVPDLVPDDDDIHVGLRLVKKLNGVKRRIHFSFPSISVL